MFFILLQETTFSSLAPWKTWVRRRLGCREVPIRTSPPEPQPSHPLFAGTDSRVPVVRRDCCSPDICLWSRGGTEAHPQRLEGPSTVLQSSVGEAAQAGPRTRQDLDRSICVRLPQPERPQTPAPGSAWVSSRRVQAWQDGMKTEHPSRRQSPPEETS